MYYKRRELLDDMWLMTSFVWEYPGAFLNHILECYSEMKYYFKFTVENFNEPIISPETGMHLYSILL